MINVYPTHNNWFKTIIPNDLSSFKIELDRYTNIPMPFQDAVDYTVKLISDLGKKIYISYSGGLDSELVVSAFKRNNIEFVAYGGSNPFAPEEFEYAKYYCKENNIKLLDFSIDINKAMILSTTLMKKKKVDIFPNYIAPVAALMQLKISKDMIIIDGACHPINEGSPRPFRMVQNEFFFEFLKNVSVIHFFNYTQEIHDAILREVDTDLDTQTAKSKLYNLPYRPKLHADLPVSMEALQKFYDQNYQIISDRKKYNSINEQHVITYDLVMENKF